MAKATLSNRLFPPGKGKGEGKIVLLSMKPSEYEKSSFEAGCKLSKIPGIYISMGKLWRDINDRMEAAGSDTSHFFWIGGTGMGFWSKDPTLRGKQAHNVTLLEGPTALIHLSMALDLLIPTGKYKYVLLDNANILLGANKPESVLKLLEIFVKKIKAKKMAAVFMFVQEEKALAHLPRLKALCQETIGAKDI